MMNPYEKYQQQMVSTMSQADMLLKLFDEALKQIDIAKASIERNDIAQMDKSIDKTKRIIQYLRSCLNLKYPVSENLKSLYMFFESELVMASVKKDISHLNDIEPLIKDLRDTFNQCARIDRADRSMNMVADVV